ncbi:thioredoxin, partial [Teladorsagia circumcincta]
MKGELANMWNDSKRERESLTPMYLPFTDHASDKHHYLHSAVAMPMREPRDVEEFDQLLNDSADSLIVIDFYATWCGPCKIMGPKFTKMSSEYPTVVFVKIDVDETEDVVSRFDIKVMPTFIFMRNGAQI